MLSSLRDAILSHPDVALCLAGLAIGTLFGAVLHATNYCVMGAVTDWRISGDKGRLGAAALAAATAIIGTQLLDAAGVVDLSKSMYLTPRLNWFGAAFGGLLFGAGMVYAGGCPSRGLVRAGGGDMRALVALGTMAIFAFATISGIFASLRAAIDRMTAVDIGQFGLTSQGLGHVLSISGLGSDGGRVAAAALLALPLIVFAVRSGQIASQPRNLLGGLAVGGLAVLGWAMTGLAADDMAVKPMSPQSLSFVRPVGDAIDWIERSTALGLPGFGASSVFGVLFGSFLMSFAARSMAFAGFADGRDLQRHVMGAAAMGCGGVLALGCTIGQGVTGLSTLSLQSMIAAAAIVGGAVIGIERLQRRL